MIEEQTEATSESTAPCGVRQEENEEEKKGSSHEVEKEDDGERTAEEAGGLDGEDTSFKPPHQAQAVNTRSSGAVMWKNLRSKISSEGDRAAAADSITKKMSPAASSPVKLEITSDPMKLQQQVQHLQREYELQQKKIVSLTRQSTAQAFLFKMEKIKTERLQGETKNLQAEKEALGTKQKTIKSNLLKQSLRVSEMERTLRLLQNTEPIDINGELEEKVNELEEANQQLEDEVEEEFQKNLGLQESLKKKTKAFEDMEQTCEELQNRLMGRRKTYTSRLG